jgi:putative flippase GtrA
MNWYTPAAPTLAHLKRVLRFAGVGVVNTGIYYACYLLLRIQVTYLIAHVCAFVIAMIASYFLNCFVTFRTAPRWRTFLLFPLSNIANFVIITVGLQVEVRVLGIDQRIAPLPAALIALPITYVVAHVVMIERNRHHGADVAGTSVRSNPAADAHARAAPRE